MANPRHRSPSVYQLPSWKNVAHLLDELEEELRGIESNKSAWLNLNKALILVALQGKKVRKVTR